ncbi:hypothetical protein KKD80_03455 [Patescibacteria group bacterium]|nr:hypothetical protein [Patescibacteria group bacterium]
MKKPFSLLIAVIVIFVIAAMAYWFLTTQSNILGENNLSVPGEILGNNSNQNQPSSGNVFANDNFSLSYPAGWRQVPAMTGISAMITKGNENITDPEAKKMNFQTYLAVSYDSVEGKTKEEIAEYVKSEVAAVFPGIVFSNEKFSTINGREAYSLEMTFSKSGVDFHVLEVVVWGNENDLWILSFNTLEELWQNYIGEFEEMTGTFIIK